MWKSLIGAALALATALLLGSCATPTTIDAQWVQPDFAGKRTVRSVMVFGVVRDSAVRRIYEDRMVAVLGARGVEAVQSYRFLPEDGPVDEARLHDLVARAGVSFGIVTRIINVTTQVNVSPGMVRGPAWGPGWGWNNGWGPGWRGFAGYYNTMWVTTTPPRVTTTENVHADTRVFEVNTASVVWSAATTTSTRSSSTQELIEQFVEVISTQLARDGIV